MVTAHSTFTTTESRLGNGFLGLLRSLPPRRLNQFIGTLLGMHSFERVQIDSGHAIADRLFANVVIRTNLQIFLVTTTDIRTVNFLDIQRQLAELRLKKSDSALLLVIAPEQVQVPEFSIKLNCEIACSTFANIEVAIDDLLYESGESVSAEEADWMKVVKTLLYDERLIGAPKAVDFNDVAIVPEDCDLSCEYMARGIYVCNSSKPFLKVRNLGFQTPVLIDSVFPKILGIYDNIEMRPDVHSGKIRNLVNKALAIDKRREGGRYTLIELSPYSSTDCFALPAYIPADLDQKSCPRKAFTGNPRYFSFEALKRAKTISDPM